MSKKIIVNYPNGCVEKKKAIDSWHNEVELSVEFPVSDGKQEIVVSDGYHTFEELYDHRITLFIALCRTLVWAVRNQDMYEGDTPGRYEDVWRSKVNGDGSTWKDYFILGINKEPGEQITYHLPLSRWEETDFAETLDKAPVWDNHTPADVLERLKKLL